LKFENRTTKGKSKGIVKKMNNKDPSWKMFIKRKIIFQILLIL
jgi:hypothetical protein